MLSCGLCGGALTSAAQPQRDKSGYIKYYRCSAHVQYADRCPEGTYANEKKLEAFLVSNLDRMLEEFQLNAKSAMENRSDHSAEIKRLEGKLSRIKDLYIDGEIDRADFDARSEPIKEELSRLREDDAIPLAVRLKAADLPPNWKSTYEKLPDEGKQLFWKKTVRRIIIFNNKPPQVAF